MKKSYRPASDVKWAQFASAPGFVAQRRRTGRQLQGLRYERKVHEKLLRDFPEHYIPSPWIKFQDEAGMRWCQPDGLLVDIESGFCTIIEVKYQHTADAWWQLTQLYLPVVQRLFPPKRWTHGLVEVVKWYDPAVAFPGKCIMLSALAHFAALSQELVGVHIFNPQREVCVER